MYTRQSRGFPNILMILVLGALAGGVYLIYDALQAPPDQTVTPLPTHTPTVVAGAPTATPEALLTSYDSINDASLFIPAIGVDAPVIRVYLNGVSWDVDNLGMNVGHLQGTRWVSDGQPGNIVLSGHVELRDGQRGIFARLGELTPGDRIVLTQDDEERLYVVQEIRNIEPDDLTPLYPTEGDQLTLITCDSYDFFSDSYLERTVVVADRIG